MIFMRLIDIGWTVFPSFNKPNDVVSPLPFLFTGIFAALDLMGIWLTLLVQQLRGARLIPLVRSRC